MQVCDDTVFLVCGQRCGSPSTYATPIVRHGVPKAFDASSREASEFYGHQSLMKSRAMSTGSGVHNPLNFSLLLFRDFKKCSNCCFCVLNNDADFFAI